MAQTVMAAALLAPGKAAMHEWIGCAASLAVLAGLLYGTRQPKEAWIVTGVGLAVIAAVLTAMP